MSIFGNLFGSKAPPNESSNLSGFKSSAEFLGATLLWQFISAGERILCTDESLSKAIQHVPQRHSRLVEIWANFYVTWLLCVHVKQKFGDDVSRDMMAAVYGRIGTNEDRVSGIESIADGLKFWFRQLDDTLEYAIANPQKINGEDVPFVYPAAFNFIMRDVTSPYAKNAAPDFDGFDVQVAQALAVVQDDSKARIDHVIARAERLPR